MIENTDTKRASGAPLYVVNGAVAFPFSGSRLATLIAASKLAIEPTLWSQEPRRYFALFCKTVATDRGSDGHAFTM